MRRISCTSDAARLVILTLGATLLLMVIGGGVINFMGGIVPDRYYDIIQAIVVGLIGLLAQTRNDPPPAGHPEPVEVVNESPVKVSVEEEVK